MFCALVNLKSRYDFLAYSKCHYIEVIEEGLVSHEVDMKETMTWDKVKWINVKKTNDEIKLIQLKTLHGNTADLSRYENVDCLCLELTKYVNKSLWK